MVEEFSWKCLRFTLAVTQAVCLLVCVDHTGPSASADLQEQSDVEQSSRRAFHTAAVLILPGRLPFLLRQTW